MIKNVGILSPGDMGSAVGRVLKQNGFNVFANLKNRSDRTRLLSQSAGISPLDSLDDLTKTCDVILSILVPSEALSVAEKVADSIKSSCDLIYVDCNAIAPSTKKDISAIIENVGCKFVDSGIIGTPPSAAGNKPKFYVSGRYAEDLLLLDDKGIEVKLIGNVIGQAAALKMCYASLTKGKMALYSSTLITANRLNIYEFLISELADSQKSMLQEMSGVNSLSTKAFRWVGEMNEISDTFHSQGITKNIHRGASEMFDLIADSPLGFERPETYDANRTLDETINVLSTVLNEKKKKT